MKNKLAVIGGDLRIAKLAIMLANDGNEVYVYGLEKSEEIRRQKNIIQCDTIRKAIDDVEIVIGPIPFSSNGNTINMPFSDKEITIREMMHNINAKVLIAGAILPEVYEMANDEYIEIIDIMKREELAVLNTIATAEGTIQVAIENTNRILHGSEVLILGFGRIGKVLARKLAGLSVKVTCAARKDEDLAWIEAYGHKSLNINNLGENLRPFDIIINTVPHIILTEQKLEYVKKETLLIDLASNPGGIDKKAILAGINYMEFRFREADYASYPKGLMYGLDVFDSWLYDDHHPFDYLCKLKVFENLKEKAQTRYFEDLIKEYLLDNTHASIVVVNPKRGLAAQRDKALEEKLEAYKSSLSKEEVEAKLAAGVPYVIRQNIPNEGTTSFEDEIYGKIEVPNSELDDMILIKSDGYPTYNFANVVDDHLMGITHVVRGNEYLSSSPKYNRLYAAFGWDVPVYVHCPLITNEEHKKLSKRCGHSSYEDLIEQGFVTEAVVNYVALLGWCPSDNREIFSLEELVEAFDYHHMNKSPAVFDMGKLRWMNGEYIKAMDFDKFFERALPYLKEAIHKDLDLKKIAAQVKTRIEVFPEIRELIDFYEEVPKYDAQMYCHKKMKTTEETSLNLLKEVLPLLEAQNDYSNDALFEALVAFGKEHGYKTGYIMWPIRTALSGKQTTPAGATEILEILGKEESIKRIHAAIEKLEK